ncbi:MAG TPA: diguanylate cyclase [Leptospiraceae bacterium]|nr:diguanylate cyclase [Leptospiraceae bacterium]HMW03445.1 diguanylate cyclase [Leptospiraceae bacterium]HMX31578.1 diguanylate cyclase [Leptospiraceae bacterium]HMY29635.1 diguanylate cyclase [Leptospiraceae bacterium]HMZ66183.1 diguanylate cyclase [Leptospiraceae bacterium]
MNEKNLLEVMSHVDYLEDKSNSLDLNSVKSLNFKKNYSGSINFGLSNSTYWFRLKIKNPTSSPIENWFFFIEYPQLDEVVFYIPMKNDSYFEKSIGDIYPFQDRDMKIRFLNLRLPNGFKEGEDVFIKVKSVPAITIPLFVGTEIAFRNKDHVRQMSIGSYIGILFIMALYNLFLFIILREAAYIYYVLFVLSVCLYVISFLGLGYEFIWSNYPYLQSHMILISSCVMLFNLCLFTISFFDTKTYAPKIHIYLIYSLVIFPLTIIFILISNSILKVYLTSTLGIIYSFLLPLIGFYVWKKGNRFARVYLFAWIPFFMAANLFILKTFGIIDKYALEINYLVQFANIFEAVVFSFALADRVRVLQKENEIAQLEMLDTMKKDIDSFRLLQAANKLANTDSLTGLHNRRYFYTLVETLWRKPDPLIPDMSMLVIDVDHFKKVNDTYGHDVGDQVLKQVAEILSKSIRNMDIVGRYGGEEFLVFLPKTNIQEAIELAEKIRVSIQEQKILLSENQILQITASIGVASRVEKEMEIDQLVKSADTMLYKAKESGRNRVVGFS